MGAKKSKLNKDVLDELCSKTKFRNYFRDNTVQFCSLNLHPLRFSQRENDRPLKRVFCPFENCLDSSLNINLTNNKIGKNGLFRVQWTQGSGQYQ